MKALLNNTDFERVGVERSLNFHQTALLSIVLFAHLTFLIMHSVLFITIIQVSLIFGALFFNLSSEKKVFYVLAALFLGAEVGLLLFTFSFLLSCLLQRSRVSLDRKFGPVIILFFYSLAIFFINSIFEFLPLNYILWIMVFFGPYAIYYFAIDLSLNFQQGHRVKIFMFSLVILQVILLVFQGWIAGSYSPGDWAIGTFLDAHKLGFILSFAMFYFGFKWVSDRKWSYLFYVCLISPFLYMCDAKAVLLSAFLAVILLSLMSLVNAKIASIIFNRVFAFYVAIALLLVLVTFPFTSTLLNTWADFSDTYLYGDYTSSKYQIYVKVWVDMFHDSPFHWLLGVGPGSLASKASNMLSADILWKPDGGIANLLPVSSSSWTKDYMAGLFGYRVVDKIPYVSAVLVYPFSGFISIKAELGLLGLALYLYVNFYMLKKGIYGRDSSLNKTLALSGVVIFISLLFDNYHEQLPIIGLFFLFLGLNTASTSRR
jgi:hypothetical protein